MPRVRIKPGLHHRVWDNGTDLDEMNRQKAIAPKAWGGSVLDVSDEEIAAFSNKFDEVAGNVKVRLIRDPAKMVKPAA
jgi:hypothetical protein